MSTALSETFTHDGLSLHYLRWGPADAPPLVLLHGLRAYAYWFEEFAEVAAARFQVISLDQRGRGASDWAPDGQYNTDAYVADLAALADHLKLDRFVLLGHSMGGTNALNYAASHPDRVAALVIVDSAPELDMAGLTRIRSELARTPNAFGSRAEALTFLREMHPRAGERSIATRMEWMLRRRETGELDWRIDPAIFDPRLTPDPPQRSWDALAKVACPTLMVRGAISDLVTAQIADRMIDTLRSGERVDIEQAAHMVVEDNPVAFTSAVLGFLDKKVPR
ncbi:alpha/beta hydrolase [Caballeronia sp. LjRoot34]|uniref:alpha/beta fold hydrolase n=1 Tax=Caballeronia sp. LjRoot34 TaxID=3342325 RepID=UPI003ECF60BF